MSWLENKIESLDDPSAPTTPSRTIGASFAPNATKWVMCSYTVEADVDATESTSVKLLSDASDPPTTERAEFKVVGAASDEKAVIRNQLTYMCPPGHFVKLVHAGTGTSAIQQQWETAFT